MESLSALEGVDGKKVQLVHFEIDEAYQSHILIVNDFPFVIIQTFRTWDMGEEMKEFTCFHYSIMQVNPPEKEKEEKPYSLYV